MLTRHNKRKMKISFVIPAYNEEHYIAYAIESIRKEIKSGDYNAEIIVVNNASTDNTEKVVRGYPDVQLMKENRKGTSWARMAGFLASRGEFVATIDADTGITPGWIATALAEFENKDNLVALSGPCIYYDLSPKLSVGVRFYYYGLYLAYTVGHRMFGASSIILGGNFIARRSALETIGGYNTDIAFYGDDADLAKRLAKVGIVKFTFRLTARTSGRRFRAEGITRTAGRYVVNYFWVLFFDKPFNSQAASIRFKDDDGVALGREKAGTRTSL